MDKLNIAKTLETNQDIQIDFKALASQRTFVCAMTRYGKSYTIRKSVEEMFGKVPIIIFDPEGEYASLREKYDFLIVGKDIPFDVELAEYIAEKALEHNLSLIIDSSLVNSTYDEQEFARRFINKFMRLQTTAKKSYLIVIEEADELAPERGTFKSNSLQSVITLTKKGAKRGIGIILATQRPAFLSKSVLS